MLKKPTCWALNTKSLAYMLKADIFSREKIWMTASLLRKKQNVKSNILKNDSAPSEEESAQCSSWSSPPWTLPTRLQARHLCDSFQSNFLVNASLIEVFWGAPVASIGCTFWDGRCNISHRRGSLILPSSLPSWGFDEKDLTRINKNNKYHFIC